MKQEVKAMKIVCDGCGEVFTSDGHVCWVDDIEGNVIEGEAQESEWLIICGRHYCPKCYHLDDNDIYHTEDGKKYDANTENEIL